MKIAFYKAEGTLFDKAIRFFTKSRYSHCELVINNICYSSSFRDNGVRAKAIYLNQDNWDVFDLHGYNEEKALAVFNNCNNQPYDLIGVLRFLFGFLPNRELHWHCSEICAYALGIDKSENYTPQDLFEYLINKLDN